MRNLYIVLLLTTILSFNQTYASKCIALFPNHKVSKTEKLISAVRNPIKSYKRYKRQKNMVTVLARIQGQIISKIIQEEVKQFAEEQFKIGLREFHLVKEAAQESFLIRRLNLLKLDLHNRTDLLEKIISLSLEKFKTISQNPNQFEAEFYSTPGHSHDIFFDSQKLFNESIATQKLDTSFLMMSVKTLFINAIDLKIRQSQNRALNLTPLSRNAVLQEIHWWAPGLNYAFTGSATLLVLMAKEPLLMTAAEAMLLWASISIAPMIAHSYTHNLPQRAFRKIQIFSQKRKVKISMRDQFTKNTKSIADFERDLALLKGASFNTNFNLSETIAKIDQIQALATGSNNPEQLKEYLDQMSEINTQLGLMFMTIALTPQHELESFLVGVKERWQKLNDDGFPMILKDRDFDIFHDGSSLLSARIAKIEELSALRAHLESSVNSMKQAFFDSKGAEDGTLYSRFQVLRHLIDSADIGLNVYKPIMESLREVIDGVLLEKEEQTNNGQDANEPLALPHIIPTHIDELLNTNANLTSFALDAVKVEKVEEKGN